MIENLELMIKKAKDVSDLIKSFPGKIHLISHYDCDGITSASIMIKALFREGKDFKVTLVKQLKEDFIKELSNEKEELIIFTDLGSGSLNVIDKELISEGKKVIIADHHQIEGESNSENLFHINSIEYGMKDNVSGAGVSYIIARTINPENIDLSQLAVIGAIGDSQIGSIGSEWGLMGLNKEILKDAERSEKIKINKGLRIWGRYTRSIHKALEYSTDPYIPGVSESESGSVQFLQDLNIKLKNDDGSWRSLADLSEEETKTLSSGIIKERIRANQENPDWVFGEVYDLLDKKGEFRDANEFATMLNSCGKLKKAYLGIALCLNDEKAFEEVKPVFKTYRRSIGKALSFLESNKDLIKEKENVTFIMAGNKVSEHIISNVTSIMQRSGMLPRDRPVFGLADAEGNEVKISARASDELVEKGLNLKEIMKESLKDMDSESGGHPGASGATIKKDQEKIFIKMIEDSMKRFFSK